MKYAIVTGGARGLGLGIVRALLEEKAVDQVAVIDLKLAPAPEDIAGSVHGFTADATDEQQVHAAIEAITAKLGPHPDVLCNNAGGGEANWFESGSREEWHSVDIWRRRCSPPMPQPRRELFPTRGRSRCNSAPRESASTRSRPDSSIRKSGKSWAPQSAAVRTVRGSLSTVPYAPWCRSAASKPLTISGEQSPGCAPIGR